MRFAMRKRSKALWAVVALLAVNAVLLVAQPGLALPNSLANYFFGPKLIRGEVVLKDGGVVHDYRLDVGTIRERTADSLVLRERDGTSATIPVAADAEIRVNGRLVPFTWLRRGMVALTVRDGENPASVVRVGRR